ncbi:MAG: hypothetical protein LBE76_01215, partial [Nitrososphaerota archaeon]|nr:hypothetical protein [Nitrososphaerota archaeon]
SSRLGCSEYESEGAIERALKLYSDLREVKLFGAYKYYYHEQMTTFHSISTSKAHTSSTTIFETSLRDLIYFRFTC